MRKTLEKLAQPILVHAAWLAVVFGGVWCCHAADEKLLRIGYQKTGSFLLVRSEGELERVLAPLGYRVEWEEFADGPTLIQALNAGSIDIGQSGDCPAIVAQAAGVPFLYIGSSKASPESEAIIVPKNSALRSIADLKGRKIAFDKGSSANYLVAAALESAGLTLADVQPVYLDPPNARAAFQSGTVDAWSIWDPFFAAAELDSDARVLVPAGPFSPHRDFYFGRKGYLEKNPEIVGPVLAVLNQAGERALKDPKGTAAFLSDKLGIDPDILLRSQLRNKHYDAIPLTSEVIAEQQKVADFLFKQGIILRPVKIADAVYRPETSKGRRQ